MSPGTRPQESKREQNARATYYYQSDGIKNKLFEKETTTSSVTKAKRQRTAH